MAVSTKQAALKVIQRIPDDASLKDIMYELYFRQRVDRGLRELQEGKTLSHAEVKRGLAKWLHREPTDYVKISRRLYKGQTIGQIFSRAKKHWKG
jgi:hypothetical protein